MKRIIAHLKENWIRYGFETLVITAGILMAFGLNNWNEQRKRSELEIQHLRNIRQSLLLIEQAASRHAGDSSYILRVIEAHENVLSSLEKDLPYHDSLNHKFALLSQCFSIDVDYSSYESLKSAGLDIITNDSLRNWTTTTYGYSLPLRQYNQNFHCEFLKEKCINEVQRWQLQCDGPPLDFEKLKMDNDFKFYLTSSLDFLYEHQAYYIQLLPVAQQAMANFDAEIARLKGK